MIPAMVSTYSEGIQRLALLRRLDLVAEEADSDRRPLSLLIDLVAEGHNGVPVFIAVRWVGRLV